MTIHQSRTPARRRGLNRTLACAFVAAVPLAAAAGPTIEFGKGSSLGLTYALQVWNQTRGFTSASNGERSNDTFLRRNRLALSGQRDDTIGFYAQLEGGGNGHGADDDHEVFFRDAYITFDYQDELRFIVGKVKNTFSRENLEACLEPLTLDRAELLSYTPFGSTRDVGAVVWGNVLDARMQYRLMVANGRKGPYAAKNRSRVTGRVHVSLWDPEYSYGYLGTYLGTQKVLTIGAAVDYEPDVAYANYLSRTDIKDYKAWTVDAFMELPTASGVFTASAAVFKYDTGGASTRSPDPALPVTADLEGYYLKAGYMLPSKVGPGRLQFFGRREKLDYGIKTGLAEYYDNTWASLGFNYYIDGQRLKLTGEFARVKFDTPHPVIQSLRDYKQATLGLQLIF